MTEVHGSVTLQVPWSPNRVSVPGLQLVPWASHSLTSYPQGPPGLLWLAAEAGLRLPAVWSPYIQRLAGAP